MAKWFKRSPLVLKISGFKAVCAQDFSRLPPFTKQGENGYPTLVRAGESKGSQTETGTSSQVRRCWYDLINKIISDSHITLDGTIPDVTERFC